MVALLAPLLPRGLRRAREVALALPAWPRGDGTDGVSAILWSRLCGVGVMNRVAGIRPHASYAKRSSGEDDPSAAAGQGEGSAASEAGELEGTQGPEGGSDQGGAVGGGGKSGAGPEDAKTPSYASPPEDASETSETSIVPAGPRPENFPKVLAVPLTRRPLFPGFHVPIHIKNQKLADALHELKARGTPYVGAFLLKETASNRTSQTLTGGDQDAAPPTGKDLYEGLHEHGTFAQVVHVTRNLDGETSSAMLMGHRRLRLTAPIDDDPLTVAVEHLRDLPYDAHDDVLKATAMEVVSTLKDLMRLNPLYKEHIAMFVQHVGDFNASRMADFGAALTTADEPSLQAVLQELEVKQRLNLTLTLLKKELELARLQASIAKGVEEKISGDQRRYLLGEQLKQIKKELGLEKDDKTALIGKFQEKLEPYKENCPPTVLQVIEEELTKLQGLESSSSEFNVTRNYLDWLTSIPWGHTSKENFDVVQAQKVLDEEHYGLTDVKERILEFIAVGSLRGTAQGKIICLAGPPGVGKTSIGRSIAHALNRKFYRFSVGGLSDVAEIKGHRRTYVGAMPGKMVQCLKTVGSTNPLVLIDEIDKLGRGHAGDPASALLELLDPEQNANFLDHYLDVPIDLSKVLFVCTANVLETIPGPLLDRMEVIRLVGYITDEKMHIARDYLEPAARKASGVREDQVEVTDKALHVLIEEYCREAGVRSLQKHIEKIYRKIALQLVRKGVTGPQEGPAMAAAAATAATPAEGGAAPSRSQSAEGRAAAEGSVAQKILDGDRSGDAALELLDMEGGPSSEESARQQEEHDKAQQAAVEGLLPAGGTECDQPAGSGEGGSGGEAGHPVVVEKIVVDERSLAEYAGNPVFQNERLYDQTPVGVVMGLAWTAMGGSTLYVETSIIEKEAGKGGLNLTGQLGDVMRESATIAHTLARQILRRREPLSTFFADARVHLHVPAGATPKDGPSAGCTMITSMLSLAMGKEVRADLAMTGEVTLTGRVLPIGGVKEKTVAARRSGVRTLVFPAANKRDFEELPAHVREGLHVHFVEHYDEVFRIVFEEDQEHGVGDVETARPGLQVVPGVKQDSPMLGFAVG